MSLIDRVLRRRSHYRAAFEGPSGQQVLADLKRFCRGMTPPLVKSPITGTVDPIATGVAIGRQEVWLRIVGHLHADDALLLQMREEADSED